MKTGRQITRAAYRIARLLNDLTTLASGNPRRIGRRLFNKVLGRAILPRLFLRGRK